MGKGTKAPDPRDVEVGRRIRAQRLVRGLSQTELGNCLGVTFQQVQKYEKGDNRVPAGRLSSIAKALGVPVAFFFPSDAQQPADTDKNALAFLDTEGAVQLAQAYAEIKDPALRRTLIALVEGISGCKGGRPRRKKSEE